MLTKKRSFNKLITRQYNYLKIKKQFQFAVEVGLFESEQKIYLRHNDWC